MIQSEIDWVHYLEPELPPLLRLMRIVTDYPDEPDPCPSSEVELRGLRGLYREDYLKFRDRLEKLEVEWLQFKTARLATTVPSEWDGNGACPTCHRGKEVPVEDLRQWELEELIDECGRGL